MTTVTGAQVEAALKAYGEGAVYVGDAEAMRAALTAAAQVGEGKAIPLPQSLHWLGDMEEADKNKHAADVRGCVAYFERQSDCLEFMRRIAQLPTAPAPLGRADDGSPVRRWDDSVKMYVYQDALAPSPPAQSGEGSVGVDIWRRINTETRLGSNKVIDPDHAVDIINESIAILTQALATERAQSDRFEEMQDEANAEADLSEARAIKAEAALAEAAKLIEPLAKEAGRYAATNIDAYVVQLRAARDWLERNRMGDVR